MTDPWRASQFRHGYSAEWLPPGQASWRIIKHAGEPVVFPTRRQAHQAAKDMYLSRIDGNIRATLPVDPERIAAKMTADAEQWLVTKREERKREETLFRAGRKPVIVMPGKVRVS